MQTCIVHQIRSWMRYANYRCRRALAKDLRPVYTPQTPTPRSSSSSALTNSGAGATRMITETWRRDLEHITPSSPSRTAQTHGYSTSTIEAMQRQIRQAIKARGHSPDEQAATKLIYLAIERAETKWRSVRSGRAPLQP